MKSIFFIVCSLLLTSFGHAQWQTTHYALKGGWNSIYLHGDATHATPDELFTSNPEILEVWRWNPNVNQVQFTSSPQIPSSGAPEWSIWVRGESANTLEQMSGNTGYLIRCSGTTSDTYTLSLAQKGLPPSATWVRNGANLLGFPSQLSGSYPTLSNYFSSFPAAIAANTKIFKYVGGEIGPQNPIQVFSPLLERVDRDQAYWFDAEVVGTFYAPIEIAPSNFDGLDFGRTGSTIAVRLRNRTDAPVTITITPTASEAAPVGQTGISGDVPLTRRVFNITSGQYEENAITGAFNEVIGAQSSIEIEFGINRGALSANSSDFYASFLRFTDSGNLMDVLIPASAQPATLAGLWIGEVEVDSVASTFQGSGSTTSKPFPLRYLLHIDDGGTARILSQVFSGELAAAPNDLGLTTFESALNPDSLESATRLSAAHMPLDLALTPNAGSVALGATAQWQISLPFTDNVNPFVHQYHPDHDNKDARGNALGNAEESYTVTRLVNFEFLSEPPDWASSTGWGSTVLGGNYSESIHGVHKLRLSSTGTFVFRRFNDIGAITLTTAP
ncbi:MAG: hypothetical protein ACSHYA_13225 [Opitutaceae bacterium]